MGMAVKLPDAREMIEQCFQAKVVPYLKGSPGCGKSALIHQIAKQYNLKVIDLRLAQCDPTDLLGFPDIDRKRQKAGYVPMATFPIEGDELPINPETGKKYSGWLLFLDELPLADKGVQKAAYKLILDKMVGEFRLHKNVVIAAAGNLETDNAMVEGLDNTALQSRMIHMEMKTDHKSWLDWARSNGIDYRITSYINFKPEVLFKFNPDHEDDTFACPRTWEFTSNLIQGREKLTARDKILLSGTISEGVAREFVGFTEVHTDLPDLKDIVTDPSGAKVPTEPSVIWCLTGKLGHEASEKNIDPLMTYVARLPKEFQVVTMREMTKRSPALMTTDAVDDWLIKNAHELY